MMVCFADSTIGNISINLITEGSKSKSPWVLFFPRIFKILLILGLCAVSRSAWSVNIFPLEPPDTSSPRATLSSFIYYTDQLHAASISSKEDARLEKEFLQRAVRCFDLSQVPSTIKTEIGIESVLMLREILDRTELPTAECQPKKKGLISLLLREIRPKTTNWV